MDTLPLAFALLTAGSIFLGFVGMWRLTTVEDPVDARLREYGGIGEPTSTEGSTEDRGRRLRGLNRALGKLSLGERMGERLARADVPLTVAEFILIDVMIAAGLAMLGWWRGGSLSAAALGPAGLFFPLIYLNMKANKRRQAFTQQLPDVLTLLTGALRAGYGITQAIDMLVDRMPKPASVEFGRVMRAVGLGIPINRALNDMADRSGSDDLYMIVTAMNVQAELGGNLAQVLDTVNETVRERITMKREIQTLTAQQRGTGYILAALPIAFGVLVSFIRPDFITPLFEPGFMRFVVGGAVLLQVLGFIVIRKIVDIEV